MNKDQAYEKERDAFVDAKLLEAVRALHATGETPSLESCWTTGYDAGHARALTRIDELENNFNILETAILTALDRAEPDKKEQCYLVERDLIKAIRKVRGEG